MTYSPMRDVSEFHDKFHKDGVDRHARDNAVPILTARLRLIAEEFEEVVGAMEAYVSTIRYFSEEMEHRPELLNSLAGNLAKELADLLYVVYGTADELGIPLENVFKAVHESNMSKVWNDGTVHYNDFGKVLKPPTYVAPDIEKILYG